MDFEALANLSWREALIAIIALLAVYVVIVFLRIHRLQREAAQSPSPTPSPSLADQRAARSGFAAYAAMQAPEPNAGAAPSTDAASAAPLPVPAPAVELFAWNEPPPGAADQPMFTALESEIALLRKEVGGLRAELQLLREEQRRDVAQSRVTQNVSPLYSDAMQLAMRGSDAASISQYCGIARAEAELVVALVRNRDAQGSYEGQDSLDLR